jgi:hypothetical protein
VCKVPLSERHPHRALPYVDVFDRPWSRSNRNKLAFHGVSEGGKYHARRMIRASSLALGLTAVVKRSIVGGVFGRWTGASVKKIRNRKGKKGTDRELH